MKTLDLSQGEQDRQRLIQELIHCSVICERCVAECLEKSDAEQMTDCMELNIDCLEICTLSARVLQQGSDISPRLLFLCAKICGQCAVECRKYPFDFCRTCERSCLTCASLCEEYSRFVH